MHSRNTRRERIEKERLLSRPRARDRDEGWRVTRGNGIWREGQEVEGFASFLLRALSPSASLAQEFRSRPHGYIYYTVCRRKERAPLTMDLAILNFADGFAPKSSWRRWLILFSIECNVDRDKWYITVMIMKDARFSRLLYIHIRNFIVHRMTHSMHFCKSYRAQVYCIFVITVTLSMMIMSCMENNMRL